MPKLQSVIELSHAAAYNGGGTNYLIQTATNVLYVIYMDGLSDVSFRKSTDNGLNWSKRVEVMPLGVITQIAVWYDKWSGLSSGLIHVVCTDGTPDDVFYRTIDTASSDALSTQTTIFLGASTANAGRLSVTRSRGGNVYVNVVIDAGAEGGFFKLVNANVPNGAWSAALTNPEALAATDQVIMLPGFAADNNDVTCIFWDGSANEISRYLYDDSANTWGETTISGTTMTDLGVATAYPNYAAAVDYANSRVIVVGWSNIDVANSDLRCWTVTETTITEVTNVVLNSGDDQGLAAITIDINGYWHVYYVGKSDGSETWPTAVLLYEKISTDQGTTWSSEIQLNTYSNEIRHIFCCPVEYGIHTPVMILTQAPVLLEMVHEINFPKASLNFI